MKNNAKYYLLKKSYKDNINNYGGMVSFKGFLEINIFFSSIDKANKTAAATGLYEGLHIPHKTAENIINRYISSDNDDNFFQLIDAGSLSAPYILINEGDKEYVINHSVHFKNSRTGLYFKSRLVLETTMQLLTTNDQEVPVWVQSELILDNDIGRHNWQKADVR